MRQIVCFGDSNTWGYNPCNGERLAWGVRWTSILQDRFSGKNIRIIEEGLCGRTTIFDDPLRPGRKGIDLFPVILETHCPSNIVIMIGTNDCKTVYGASPDVIGKGIIRLLKQARQILPHSNILLISPIYLGDDVWKNEFDPEFSSESVKVSQKLKEVYMNIAKDYNVDFLAASDYAKCSEDDQEHMGPQGHKALADAIEKKLLQSI